MQRHDQENINALKIMSRLWTHEQRVTGAASDKVELVSFTIDAEKSGVYI